MSVHQEYTSRSVVFGFTVFCAAVVPQVRGDAFSAYQHTGSFLLPAGSGPFDPLSDGRLLVLVGSDVYIETAPSSQSFTLHGTLAGADFPSFGAAFVRVSPNGMKIAVGNNGGASFSNYQVGVFDLPALSGTWFTAGHFDGEWIDNTLVALTAGDFSNPSIVTVLDTSSPNPLAPINPTIVDNIGGASGGIAFDAAANLYSGNGFTTSGPSGTGAIKMFSNAAWTGALSGGPIIDFEAEGTLIVDVLSASPIGFDAEGNFFVGGGDFSSSTDLDFVALVRQSAVAEAIAGMGAADPNDSAEVRQLDPDSANDFNFFTTNANPITHALYVREGDVVHMYHDTAFVPTVSQWGLANLSLLLTVAGTLLLRRRPIPQTACEVAR